MTDRTIDWMEEGKLIESELVEIRHWLHSHPESGNKEFLTSEYIKDKLRARGVRVIDHDELPGLPETAVVGIIQGDLASEGKCVAIRSDIDALSIKEETGVDFASSNLGLMHACGHDFHMTCALGAAFMLAKHKAELAGTVKFFFQPDEEGDGGAKRMIAAGVLDNPKVDAVFGAHVNPDLEAGVIGIKYNKMYAASDMFDIEITGKSCHGAQPEDGIDALLTGAKIVSSLKKLNERLHAETGKLVISTGVISSGNARNIIADKCCLKGIIRTFGKDQRKLAKDEFVKTVNDVAASHGAEVLINIIESYGGVVNTDCETAFCENAAKDFAGEDVEIMQDALMTTEDFGYFIEAAGGGCYYSFGTGGEYPLHNSRFLPDDRLLGRFAAFHGKLLWDYCTTHQHLL